MSALGGSQLPLDMPPMAGQGLPRVQARGRPVFVGGNGLFCPPFVFSSHTLAFGLRIVRFVENLLRSQRTDQIDGRTCFDTIKCACQSTREKPELFQASRWASCDVATRKARIV